VLPLLLATAMLASACATVERPPRIVAAQGQTAEQLDRDRYQCALEAQRQVGADDTASLTRGMLIGGIVVGAFGAGIGAGIGALTGSVGNGAIGGAITGGGLGGAIGSNVALSRDLDARERALHACLDARGYVVREPEIVR
jgi:hypothetical protein